MVDKKKEKELIKKAQKGDVSAFEELVLSHRDGLFSYALNITCGDYSAASDILQDAFLKAFIYLKNFKGNCSFMTWLWRITRNEFINFKTSKKTAQHYSLDSVNREQVSDEDIEDTIDVEMKKQRVRLLIKELPDQYGEAIALIDLQGLTYEEGAEILDVSVSALKSRLFRAREKFAELVRKNKKLFI